LGLVALGLGLFVVRPLLSQSSPQPALALPGNRPDPDEDDRAMTALTGEIDDSDVDANSLAVIPNRREPPGAALTTQPGEDAVARLRGMIGERQEETVEILRNWLEGEEEKV
jgi:flagellar M-ring protein FliF